MSTKKLTKILSGFMAIIMLLLALLPLSVSAATSTAEAPAIDYTPFMLEYENGAVYNRQTAELSYNFYKEAKKFVDNNAGAVIQNVADGKFSFEYNNIQYSLNSTYIQKPVVVSTCGLLIGVLSYTFNGEEKYIMMIMFEGTDTDVSSDIITDLNFVDKKVDSDHHYHQGFYEAARNHYSTLSLKTFSLGDKKVTLPEYIEKMKEEGNNYQMLVTGHSLGAAVANIFTSYFVDVKGGDAAQKNAVAYTFATPLTCSDGTANKSGVKNIFNFINKWDWVTQVGYGGISATGMGAREGIDLKYTAGEDKWQNLPVTKIMANHKMSAKIYGSILDKASDNIYKSSVNPLGSFVLYNKFNPITNTYQRIIYHSGKLIVCGNDNELAGDWSQNAFVNFTKIASNCRELIFDTAENLTKIGAHAFYGMSHLTNVLTLPDSLTTIGEYAFYRCGFRGELKIPNGMTKVGEFAFFGCSALTSINAKDAVEMVWGIGAFADCIGDENEYLHLPNIEFSLQLFGVYYLEDSTTGITRIEAQDRFSGNYVAPGNKIHVGCAPEEYLKEKPNHDFYYYLLDSRLDSGVDVMSRSDDLFYDNKTKSIEGVADISDQGVVTVSPLCPEGTKFTVIFVERVEGDPCKTGVAAENIDQRAITFTVRKNTNFAGGLGTSESPYLISSAAHLANIKNDLSAYYRLINTIDCSEHEWKSLASTESAPFMGTLDGNGYSITNMTGAALFAYNNGTIKNLVIDGANLTSLAATNGGYAYASFFVGKNMSSGEILNCSVINNAKLDVTSKYSAEILRLRIGGICGENIGTVSHCSVTTATINGYGDSSGAYKNNHGHMGSIVGCLLETGKVKNCYAQGNTIYLHLKHASYDKWGSSDNDPSTAYFKVGGLVGACYGTAYTFENCIAHANIIDTKWSKVIKGSDVVGWDPESFCKRDKKTDAFSGYFENTATVTACYSDSSAQSTVLALDALLADTTAQSIFADWSFESGTPQLIHTTFTGITVSAPYKTKYYLGEKLNLFGLKVKKTNAGTTETEDNAITGYFISGFDSTKSGECTVKVSYLTGYSATSLESEFTVTVECVTPIGGTIQPCIADEESAGELVFEINHTLKLSDLRGEIYFNNGDITTLEDLSQNDDVRISFSQPVKYATGSGNSAVLGNGILDTVGTQMLMVECHYAYTDANGVSRPASLFIPVMVLVECEHATTVLEDVIAPTNSEYGYTGDVVCTICKEIISEGKIIEIVDKLPCVNHTWDTGVISTPATHTTEGEKLFTCTVCDTTKTEVIPPDATAHSFGAWERHSNTQHKRTCGCGEIEYVDHIWDEGIITAPATHTTEGEKLFTCTVCQTTKTEVILADVTAHTFGAWERHSNTQHKRACGCGEIEYVDHIWDDGIITTPATHTTEGEKLFTCTVCQTTKTEVIPADVTAHTFGAWERHSNTQHKRTCGCGEIEYADHTWDDGIITTPATHIATGVKTYTCTNCVATKTETVSPLGHVYNLQIATSKYLKQSATCTTTALYYYSCSCGERGESTFAYGSALHHSFTTYLYNNNATCEKDGTETAQCDRCSTMDTRTKVGSMLSHAWSTAWTTNREGHYRACNNCDAVTALEEHISGGAATATSPEICTTCGYMITPMLGHTHSLTYISAEEPSCTQAGNIPYYICSGCEKMYRDVSATEELSVVNIPALDHNYVETVTQPTCTEAGYTTHTCSRCTESYVDSHTSAKGHSPGAKATCTTAQLCTVCSYEIAGATGHSFTRYISDENATCEADGTLTATCDHCTATDTTIDTASAIGHHYDQGIITQAPDCEVDGIKTFTCANDATHTYTESIPAKTHAYGAWVTVTEPTNLAVGKLTRVCVHNAAHIEEKELPILNGNDYACTAISAPTCEGTGTELYEIILDGQKFTYLVTLPATGHSFDTALQSDGTHHFTVCACGVKKDSTAHIFAEIANESTQKSAPTCTDPAVYSKSCAICGYIGAESFVSGAANGHSFADGACTRCGTEDPNGVNPIVIPVAATGTVALGGAAVYLIIRKKKRI